MTSLHFHWIDDLILPLLVILVRIAWLSPWLVLLQRWLTPSHPGPLLPVWVLFALFVLGALLTRLVIDASQSLGRARVWLAASGLLVIFGILWGLFFSAQHPIWDLRWLRLLADSVSRWTVEVPAPFLALVVATGVWIRGVLDGQRSPTRDQVWSAVATGTLALALLLLSGQLDPKGVPTNTDRWLVAYFAAGLSALALSSLEFARFQAPWGAQEQPRLSLNRYWLVSVSFVIAVMVGLVLALGLLITPSAVARAFGWVLVIADWFGIVLGYVLLVVAYAVFLVLSPLIEWLQARIAEAPPREPQPAQEFGREFEEFAQQFEVTLSPATEESLRWLWLAALVLVVVLAIVFALRLLRRGEKDSADETREIIFSRDLLQAQLASLWQDWLHRFQGPAHSPETGYLSLEGEEHNRRSIRAIYQASLARAAALGTPRKPPQTPHEYQAELEAHFPDPGGAWQELTEGYNHARYGSRPPSEQELARARDAWACLQPRLISPQDMPDDAT